VTDRGRRAGENALAYPPRSAGRLGAFRADSAVVSDLVDVPILLKNQLDQLRSETTPFANRVAGEALDSPEDPDRQMCSTRFGVRAYLLLIG
jgi:hypothetical protein